MRFLRPKKSLTMFCLSLIAIAAPTSAYTVNVSSNEGGPQIAFASDPGLLDAAKRFEALSNTDRAAWFTKNQDAIMHCRATLP